MDRTSLILAKRACHSDVGDFRNLKWDELSHFTSRQANLYAACFHCRRKAYFDAKALSQFFQSKGWRTNIETVASKLRCKRCGRPPSKLGPTRQLGNTPLPANWVRMR